MSRTFDMDYQSSIDLDKRLYGMYVGPLSRVVTRILQGYNFFLKADNGSVIVTVVGVPNVLAASPAAPASGDPRALAPQPGQSGAREPRARNYDVGERSRACNRLPHLLSVFTRPSVKNYRKSSCRDFRSPRRFLQCGGEFNHFGVGKRADQLCDLVDLYGLWLRFPQFGREFDRFAVGQRADEFCDFLDMV